MKAIYKILFFVLAGIGCAACEKPDLSESHGTQTNGLLNVTMQIPDNPAEYYATKQGKTQWNIVPNTFNFVQKWLKYFSDQARTRIFSPAGQML